MKTQSTDSQCPRCGEPLPVEAAHGLCPKCLLAAASTLGPDLRPTTSHPPPSVESLQVLFPQLEILELIGAGGMGAVYKVRQPKLERVAALKILPETLAKDPAFAERFGREARVLARLNHPNIVTIFDFGQVGELFYLLMEYVDGVNLRQAMEAGRFTPAQALALVPRICEALQFAHEEGILHRDIKPENILLDTKGRVKIADFGIAKLIGEADRDLGLTASGVAVGTPNYMAPEQLERPHDVDQRADIYSLGVVLYEMLTGELPIGRFALPSQKGIPDPRVDEVVLRALEKEREKRYRTATEVKESVEALQTPAPPSTVSPAGAGAPPGRLAGAPRWSVKSIVGAMLVAMSGIVVALFLVFWAIEMNAAPGPTVGMNLMVVLIVLLPTGLLGLAGAILGIMGLSDIRHAAGRLRGLVFAVVATLTWPLLVADWGLVIAGIIVIRFLPRSVMQALVVPCLLLGLLLGLVFNLLVAIALWRWGRGLPIHPLAGERSSQPGRGFWMGAVVGLGLILLLLIVWIIWAWLSSIG